MAYKPLSEYGLIGNLDTCALVGRDGSIDWCCFPRLDSPSVFAALLDERRGGHFSVRPAADYDATQAYVPRTNVLETTFETADGTATLTDFMPVTGQLQIGHTKSTIYRRLTCESGSIDASVEFRPQFDYARAETRARPTENGAIARGNREHLFLSGPDSFVSGVDEAHTTFTLDAGESEWFVLEYDSHRPVSDAMCEQMLQHTVDAWQDWAHSCPDDEPCPYGGPWHDEVVRSALTLRLLINWESQGMAAAPTTSLPEEIGGERNWDYRFGWVRDTAFTIQALNKLDHPHEARDMTDWCLDRAALADTDAVTQPLFGLHTASETTETILDHLSGYRDSSPVRIGNEAGDQRQLDIYGELVLPVYEQAQYDRDVLNEEWSLITDIVDAAAERWDERDHGIWEIRSQPRHNVHSKLMCWAAVDRGLKLAREHEFAAPIERWEATRDDIREAILTRGYSETAGSFVRAFEDDDVLDTATLQAGLIDFLPCDDYRVQGTIDAVLDRLTTDEGLVYRYEGEDGVPGHDNPFFLSSFWLVECLALSGRVEEARELFDGVVSLASPTGLLSEEAEPETGALRGNYPQAFSHIGLINSAMYLHQADEEATGVAPLGSTAED